MTNNLGEEAEAFFRSGEEGTYEGGPASIAPLAVSEEPAEVWDLASREEWLDRRRRLQRFVATVVGGLSAGLILLSVCLLAAHARGTKNALRAPRPAPAPQEAARTPRPESAPRIATAAIVPAPTTAAIIPAPTTVAVQPVEPTLPARANGAAELAPSPLPRTEPATRIAPVTRIEPRTRSNVVASRQRVSIGERRPNPRPAVALPRGGADLPSLAGAGGTRRDPPTAYFPN